MKEVREFKQKIDEALELCYSQINANKIDEAVRMFSQIALDFNYFSREKKIGNEAEFADFHRKIMNFRGVLYIHREIHKTIANMKFYITHNDIHNLVICLAQLKSLQDQLLKVNNRLSETQQHEISHLNDSILQKNTRINHIKSVWLEHSRISAWVHLLRLGLMLSSLLLGIDIGLAFTFSTLFFSVSLIALTYLLHTKAPQYAEYPTMALAAVDAYDKARLVAVELPAIAGLQYLERRMGWQIPDIFKVILMLLFRLANNIRISHLTEADLERAYEFHFINGTKTNISSVASASVVMVSDQSHSDCVEQNAIADFVSWFCLDKQSADETCYLVTEGELRRNWGVLSKYVYPKFYDPIYGGKPCRLTYYGVAYTDAAERFMDMPSEALNMADQALQQTLPKAIVRIKTYLNGFAHLLPDESKRHVDILLLRTEKAIQVGLHTIETMHNIVVALSNPRGLIAYLNRLEQVYPSKEIRHIYTNLYNLAQTYQLAIAQHIDDSFLQLVKEAVSTESNVIGVIGQGHIENVGHLPLSRNVVGFLKNLSPPPVIVNAVNTPICYAPPKVPIVGR
jgi:hypothetical protein